METVATLVDGKKLREARLNALLTQRELGSRSGVAPETINRIENARGPRSTTAITFRKLAAALEVDPDELLAEE
jgi:transcriptional regulator with XRE-family HTH domain